MKGMLFSHHRRTWLLAVTVASLIWTVLPGSSAAEPLTFMYTHVPPLQYAPEYMQEEMPGISLEIIDLAMKKAGIAYELKCYPPARLVNMALEGDVDLSASNASGAERFQTTMMCGKPVINLEIALYQNTDRETPLTDIRSELTGKKILAPGESQALFESLIPQGNVLQEIIKAEFLVPMFAGQRASYMIDYVPRAEAGLQQEPPSFEYAVYPLLTSKIVFCIRKDFPDAATVLHEFTQAFLSLKGSPEVRQLEKKYGMRYPFVPDSSDEE